MISFSSVDALSGEQYFSISYLKPVLHLFNEGLLKHDSDDTELTKSIKTTVAEYLNKKYDDVITDDLLDMASLVDPRFKTKYMKGEKTDTVNTRAMTEMLEEAILRTSKLFERPLKQGTLLFTYLSFHLYSVCLLNVYLHSAKK